MLSSLKKKIYRIFEKKGNSLHPDEIFLDSQNLPDFNKYQFEGRIERPIPFSTFIIFTFVCIFFASFIAYSLWDLGITQGKVYAEISENNSLKHEPLIAPRGIIYDRNGTALAWNAVSENPGDFPKRKYIGSLGFGHVLGFLNYPAKDTSGFYYRESYEAKDGVELSFDEYLSGKNGLKITETDVRGDIVSESVIDKPQEGAALTLSIDSRIQTELYKNIQALAEQVDFQGGAGIIMDVNSGEVIALTSFPEYSSSIMTEGSATSTIQSYSTDENKPFLDRIVSGLYTPGSIIKPFMALGALEEGIITPEKQIVSNGRLVLPNPYSPENPSIFLDWKAHGAVDMRHAIAVSSDVYFYQIGGGFGDQKGLGILNIDKYMRLFGFGQKTGFDLGTEAVGNIPTPEWKEENFPGDPWRVGNTYHTVIGQYGMQVTPLQAVRAIAALANGGVLVTPTVVKTATTTVPVGDRIPIKSQSDLQVVREGMRLAITEGTAKGLDMGDVVHLAGKTGTAELGVSKSTVNSWTVGFFPYENPRYAYLVVMEKGPVTNLVGATYVMRRTMDWIVANAPEYIK